MYIPFYELDAAEEVKKRGIEEGIEKGIEKGRLEGRFEGKLEVARNLLARGVSVDIIAESAELPQEKVLELMN